MGSAGLWVCGLLYVGVGRMMSLFVDGVLGVMECGCGLLVKGSAQYLYVDCEFAVYSILLTWEHQLTAVSHRQGDEMGVAECRSLSFISLNVELC